MEQIPVALHLYALPIALFFLAGYTLITFEHVIKVNKATIALIMAIFCWALIFIAAPSTAKEVETENFLADLAEVSQILFFLLGALAIVELISAHRGFDLISNLIQTKSKRLLLAYLTVTTFFLSAVLDNLTTTIVMLAVLRKLVPEQSDRWIFGGAIVIAANAGGAWSPIGDVTTTMLWIGGQLTTVGMVSQLFLPSFVCAAAGSLLLAPSLKGQLELPDSDIEKTKDRTFHSKFFLLLGIALLLFVPIFKILTGLPPFMGMLLSLSILWIITDIFYKEQEDKNHLRMPYIFSKVDLSSILFFLGILLTVAALRSAGLLTMLSKALDLTIGNTTWIAVLVGLISAIVDNVPLVAATMSMYELSLYPTDHSFWQLIAFCAGTGGSILIIGSAAGIVFMSMEKIDFFSYLRKVGFAALASYFLGVFVYTMLL
jgi:Na+/H+ antiporter NhaD/arsenite permease-like protein